MPKRPDAAKVQLKLRCREPLRARLEKSAARRDVSINEEMIRRLEESFDLDARYGRPHVRDIAQTVAGMIRTSEARTKRRCTEDLETFRAVQMAMAGYFGLPFGDTTMFSDRKKWEVAREVGEAIARDALKGLSGLPKGRVDEWVQLMRKGEAK